jgi:hypothetical protein
MGRILPGARHTASVHRWFPANRPDHRRESRYFEHRIADAAEVVGGGDRSSAMRTTTSILLFALAMAPTGCVQFVAPASPAGFAPDRPAFPQQEPDDGRTNGQTQTPQPRGRPYGATRVRLQLFREGLEFDELDVEFDSGPDGKLYDIERDRFGFRAEFGSRGVGGFVQVFGEELEAEPLFGEDFDNFGIGGGVNGTPVVGRAGKVEFLVPFEFEINVAAGSESVGGFDTDLLYLDTQFDVGFGARAFGAQASTGIVINAIGALYETDDPSSAANGDPALIHGTNIGAYIEVLYKHDRVPLMARARAIVGDVSGVMLSFGFAF